MLLVLLTWFTVFLSTEEPEAQRYTVTSLRLDDVSEKSLNPRSGLVGPYSVKLSSEHLASLSLGPW